MLIAIEGIDGSGKGTQAKRLADRLNDAGRRAALISFPRYSETLFGRAIGEFLNGRFGSLNDVHPFLAALLYAGDRFESRPKFTKLMEEYEVVICDRYVASNLAHQGAKASGDERTELLERVQQIEHRLYGLPSADLTLLLDLSVERAQSLIARKNQRDYTDRKADLQEADATYLQRVRSVYHDLSAASPETWRRLECETAGELRSMDDIAAELFQVVIDRLNQDA